MCTNRQSGFSLLEVLVAFAILSMSLGVLYQAFSNSLRNVGASGDYSRAMIIAVSYTHLTLPTRSCQCRSRWAPSH